MQNTYTFSNGKTIQLIIKKTAKKNIILRPFDKNTLMLSIPPWLSTAALNSWLMNHEPSLQHALANFSPTENTLPTAIWHYGQLKNIITTHIEKIQIHHSILLPNHYSLSEKRQALQQHLYHEASNYLLPRLETFAQHLKLSPNQIRLSRAKTFWGICRHYRNKQISIRLNWRLIGAPQFVVDYVCIHELCHIIHANHSSKFWQLVNRHTSYTTEAKAWLKAHGRELFLLD